MDFDELDNMHLEAPDGAATMFRSFSRQMIDKLGRVEAKIDHILGLLRKPVTLPKKAETTLKSWKTELKLWRESCRDRKTLIIDLIGGVMAYRRQ